MRNVLLSILVALVAISCKNEDPPYNPSTAPLTLTTAGGTDVTATGHVVSDTNPMTSADTGAGECGQFQLYTCRGWHAGIYKNGSMQRFDFDGVGDGKLWADCDNFPMCVDSIGDADNALVYAACKQMREQMGDPNYPTNPYTGGTAWTYDRTEYVFADNALYGTLPGGIIGTVTPTNLGCGEDWIPPNSTTPMSPQCLTGDCLPPDQCPPEAQQSCSGWQPSAYVTSSLVSKTYTTTINDAWLDALTADYFDQVAVCDAGAWTWSTTANPDQWRMQDLDSTDLLYVMGFRNNDEQLKVKRTGGSTWYNLYGSSWLDGLALAATAFAVLGNENAVTFQFKRGASTYTMNATRVGS